MQKVQGFDFGIELVCLQFRARKQQFNPKNGQRYETKNQHEKLLTHEKKSTITFKRDGKIKIHSTKCAYTN